MQFLKFSAEWCGPCKTLAPILSQISDETRIPISNVDVDLDPSYAAQWSVVSVPTTVLLDDTGMEILRVVGAKPYPAMMSALALG